MSTKVSIIALFLKWTGKFAEEVSLFDLAGSGIYFCRLMNVARFFKKSFLRVVEVTLALADDQFAESLSVEGNERIEISVSAR